MLARAYFMVLSINFSFFCKHIFYISENEIKQAFIMSTCYFNLLFYNFSWDKLYDNDINVVDQFIIVAVNKLLLSSSCPDAYVVHAYGTG